METRTILLDSIGVECALTAIAEKMNSIPKNHPARANYELTYRAIKGKP